jgi:oligopeptide/dipeptide ABC transporter ATP-binding protein
MSPVLSVSHLSVEFATTRGPLEAVRDVSFDIAEQEILGVVGESGCGKSTLVNAILGLLAANGHIVSGSISLTGQRISAMTEAELNRLRGEHMAVVFQDPMTTLNPVRSIGRQMVDIQYRRPISTMERRQRAAEMLDQVGISDPRRRLSQYPHELSGGMRQRIAIAMAMLAEPALLIADEPTTALDATLEVQIINLLRKLQEKTRCSILFISHHLGLIAELCDRVVVMYAGEVIERGSVRDVFHRPAHPYTQLLLECDPARSLEASRRLRTIKGELPDLTSLPRGCIFASRCPFVFAACDERPPAYPVAVGHAATCHLLAGLSLK